MSISTNGLLTSTKHCSIRHITAQVGAAVVRAAVAEDLAEGCCDVGPRELGSMSEVPSTQKLMSHSIVQGYGSVWTKFIVLLTVGNGGLRCSQNVVPYLQPPCERQINRNQLFLTFHSKECIRLCHLFWLKLLAIFNLVAQLESISAEISCPRYTYMALYRPIHLLWLLDMINSLKNAYFLDPLSFVLLRFFELLLLEVLELYSFYLRQALGINIQAKKQN